jgi:hypothetical protein
MATLSPSIPTATLVSESTRNLGVGVALHILDTEESSLYLELRGDATVEPDLDYVFADRLGAKYGGLNLRNMDRPGEHRTVVTVSLTRVRAVDMRLPGTVGSSLRR